MKIILNHTLRSIKAHIGQPIVIVLTVTVVTMLFFASLSLKDLFYNFQLANLSRVTQGADVAVEGGLFSGQRLDEFTSSRQEEVEYVDKYLTSAGIINGEGANGRESTAVIIEATDLNSFLTRHKSALRYYKGISEADYVHPEIWISRALADKLGCTVGSVTEIFVGFYGRNETFTVTYIFENEGFFANSTVHNILTDLSAFGDKGLYTEAYIKLKQNVDKDEFVGALSEYMDNAELKIDDAVDYEYIERVVSDNENLLEIALIFVVALVIFILFGAYGVVARNRASEMLVFKAVGAGPLRLFSVLMTEVILYGITGGALGTVCGRFGMEIVVQSVIPGFSDAVVYSVFNYVASVFLGIVISVAGSIVPVVNLVRRSVKRQNDAAKTVKKVRPVFILIPVCLICASAVGVAFAEKTTALFTICLTISAVLLVILAAPYVMNAASALFGVGKGVSRLASVSVKRNAEAVSLSCMLGAVLTFAFITVSIVGIIIDASKPSSARFDADYTVQAAVSGADMESVNELLNNTPGIGSSDLLRYEKFETVINGRETDLTVYAAEKAEDLACALDLSDSEKEVFDNEENAAVFSYDMLNRLGKKVGDEAEISLNGKSYKFRIIASDEEKTANDRVIFINAAGCDYPFASSVIFVNADGNMPQGDLYADVKDRLQAKGCYILGFGEWAYAASVGVDGIARLLRILQIIVIAVGFAGIANMTIAMTIKRRREFGIYRSAGLDEGKYFLLMLAESVEISVCGVILGTVLSLTVNSLIPSFAALIDRHITATFPWEIFAIAGITVAVYAVIYCAVAARYKMKKIGIERNGV